MGHSTSSGRKKYVKYDEKQIGKKSGKHAEDFGLDPSKEEDRLKFIEITENIIEKATIEFRGEWPGVPGESKFYVNGADVVIVSSEGKYVTTMRDAVLKNKRIKGMMEKYDM